MSSIPPEPSAVISPEILYFGTPIAVLSTLNPDGTTNLAAMSSFWALGERFMLGLTSFGQTGRNLSRTSECVLNFPSPAQWQHVERLGHTTGRDPLSEYHRDAGIEYVKDKFAASGFSAIDSEVVKPMRVAQCPVQIEARLLRRHEPAGEAGLLYFEVQRIRVHAHRSILNEAGSRIDVDAWSPLFYVFRHYFGKGGRLGRSFRARY